MLVDGCMVECPLVSIRRDMQLSGIRYVGRDSTGSHGPLLDEFSPVALAWLALAMPFREEVIYHQWLDDYWLPHYLSRISLATTNLKMAGGYK